METLFYISDIYKVPTKYLKGLDKAPKNKRR